MDGATSSSHFSQQIQQNKILAIGLMVATDWPPPPPLYLPRKKQLLLCVSVIIIEVMRTIMSSSASSRSHFLHSNPERMVTITITLIGNSYLHFPKLRVCKLMVIWIHSPTINCSLIFFFFFFTNIEINQFFAFIIGKVISIKGLLLSFERLIHQLTPEPISWAADKHMARLTYNTITISPAQQ